MNPPKDEMLLLITLRGATRKLHDETEHVVNAQAMMCTDYSPESYASMLLAQYNFHHFLEHVVAQRQELLSHPQLKWQERIKTPYLQQDLEALGLWPALPLEWEQDWYDAAAKDGILGFLYVSEGSMNGAFHILRALEKNPTIAKTEALNFYRSYRDKGRALWTDFMLYMQQQQEQVDTNQAVKGAITAFYLFQRAFQEVEQGFTANI